MIVNILDAQTISRSQVEPHTATAPRRSMRAASAALALLALGLAAGCGATRPIKYYDLSIPGGLAPATAQTLPVTIIVGLPNAPDLYRNNRLVYATSDQALGAYQYERWVAPPPEMIRDVLVRSLRASGRYVGVHTAQSSAGGDYSLRMHLYEFREQDAAGSLSGRLSMDVELRSIKTGETVWQHYYNHDEPIASRTVPDVVAALNRNVQMAATEISSDLDQYFAAHPPK